ncbi:MAG: HlyC/CorC family transporter [Bacilli bacterium]|nr:HlyC/CorC family transporter [Bacilli bacterium]
MSPLEYFLAGSVEADPLSATLIGIALILLVLCSSFFSASEMAFSTVNVARLRTYVEEKRKGAKQALWIADHFDRTLTTILVGNNLVNIAATSLAGVLIGMYILNPTISNIVNIFGMTLIVLIFGEIVPKSRAKENAERFTIRYSKILFVIIKILTPFVKFFMWLNKILVKKSKNDNITVTESELESIIDTMEEEGVIDSDDADLMQSVLDISDRTIYDIMIPRVDIIAIDIEMTVEEIKNIFFEYKFSRLPVYRDDKDHIIGILSERDFFTQLLQNGEEVNILELVTRPLYVSKTMKVDDLIRRMQIEKKHFAIVSDEYGGTSGIVTMEDALEEIVGEIYDEHDDSEDEATDIIKIDDNTYNISADVPLDDLFQTLELGKAPESSYTNLGGFLYSLAEQVPTEGEQLEWIANCLEESDDELLEEQKKNLLFTILEVKERRIIRVKLEISDILEDEEETESTEE